jgi:hypothetical protein
VATAGRPQAVREQRRAELTRQTVHRHSAASD